MQMMQAAAKGRPSFNRRAYGARSWTLSRLHMSRRADGVGGRMPITFYASCRGSGGGYRSESILAGGTPKARAIRASKVPEAR